MKLNIVTRRRSQPPPRAESALQRLEEAIQEADRVLARTLRADERSQALYRIANGLGLDWTPRQQPPTLSRRLDPAAAVQEAERLVQAAL